MAQFCLLTKMSPEQYRQLSFEEYTAFLEALTGRVDQNEWQQL